MTDHPDTPPHPPTSANAEPGGAINQTVEWLRGLAVTGGKGVVNNIDARCLGRIAGEIEALQKAAAINKAMLDRLVRAVLAITDPHAETKRASGVLEVPMFASQLKELRSAVEPFRRRAEPAPDAGKEK
jgi:hypothetical protein